jgi:hypothetical protein
MSYGTSLASPTETRTGLRVRQKALAPVEDQRVPACADPVRTIGQGEALLAPRITQRLIAQFAAVRSAHHLAEDRLAELTSVSGRCSPWWARGSATRRSPSSW